MRWMSEVTGRLRERSRTLQVQAVLVAAVCLVADLATFAVQSPWTSSGVLATAVSLVAIVVVDAALAGPPRRSGVVAVAHVVVQTSVLLLLAPSDAIYANDTGMLVAGYRAGAWLAGTTSYATAAVLVAGTVSAHVVIARGWGDLGLLPVEMLAAGLLPWLVGRYTTGQRAHLAELEKRAELERRDAQQRLADAITADRSAIARDLHDVIAHHVSAINLHAGAARLGLDPGNDRLATSLGAVETASRAAMVDLRHLLGLLHGDDPDDARQPGLDNLDELVDGVRAAGVPVTLTTSGVPGVLPESLGVTVYRIVQEMLTNALRHGDPAGVDVELSVRGRELQVVSTNPVRTDPSAAERSDDGNGRGLLGIRSRARIFDGTTTSGLDPDGRTWRTTVVFPLVGGS